MVHGIPRTSGTVPGLNCTCERRRKSVTQIHAGLVFQAYLVFEVFQDACRSNKENPVYTGMLPCLVPENGLKLCKFVSRSGLVLISFRLLTIPIPWTFYPISFYRQSNGN